MVFLVFLTRSPSFQNQVIRYKLFSGSTATHTRGWNVYFFETRDCSLTRSASARRRGGERMPWPKTVAAKLGLPGRAIIGLVDCDGLDLERLVRQLLSTVPLGRI